MVPLKLSLKNFLSYGQTTQYIDFEPHNLICLSGKNGHGKSALLDAITWVLWGYARKANTNARADENLVRLGQTQMMVSLEFMCNDALYRVRRELNITSTKTQTALDFGIIDPQTRQIRGLTDKTIRATQEKIIATLGLDYESFINSVFLRQGHSNEFSKKSPKERKEILTSILGISQFELIKKKALEKSRNLAIQRDTLLPIHQRLSFDITQKETLTQALTNALEKEKNITEKQHHVTAQLQSLEIIAQQYKQDAFELQQAQELQAKLHIRLTTSLQDLLTSRAEFKKNLHKRIYAHTDYSEHDKLERELELLQAAEFAHLELQQQVLRITQELQQYSTRLEATHVQKIHAADIALQQSQSRMLFHEKRAAEVTQKIMTLTYSRAQKSVQDDVIKLGTQYEKYREIYQKWVSLKNILLPRVEDYNHSLKKLTEHHIAYCPTCEQALEYEKKSQLCRAQQRNLTKSQHQLQRLQRLLPLLKQAIITMHGTLETSKEVQQLKTQEAHLALELSDITTESQKENTILQKALEEKHALILEQKTLFLQDIHYQELFKQLAATKNQLSVSPAISPERKKKLIEDIKVSRAERELSPENLTALLHQIKKVVHVTIKHIKELKLEQQKVAEKITILHKKIVQPDTLENSLQTLRAESHSLTQELNHISQDIGSYKEQLSRLELQEEEFARLSLNIKEFGYEHELYQSIAQAVGKDGIQALLIEQALPEIEQEANSLLERLTDGQAHLFIESLRDLKSGKTKETLDIHISDATGIRSYELFSGGEAFRIDFALRIALSKLLARRAGTSLQTLIIDEGFGSQDEEGLTHIMDALYKIQDDFAKIIIVSHLPYMKDQFPVHFIVSKTAQGSNIKVIEQG